MLKYYLISFDLKGKKSSSFDPNQLIDKFFNRIWIKPFESFYIVQSKYSAVQIANILKQSLDPDDNLFVLKIDKENWAIRTLDVNMTQQLNDF